MKAVAVILFAFLVSASSYAEDKSTDAERSHYIEIIRLKIEYLRKLKEKDEIIGSMKDELAEKNRQLEEAWKNTDVLTREINKMISENKNLLNENDRLVMFKKAYYPKNKEVSRLVQEMVYGFYAIRGCQ